MGVALLRSPAAQRTTAVVTSSGPHASFLCFSTGRKTSYRLRRRCSQHLPTAPGVCYSSINPSQQLHQALDLQWPRNPHVQTPCEAHSSLSNVDSSPVSLPTQSTEVTAVEGPNSTRRDVVITLQALAGLLLGYGSFELALPKQAEASKLGAAADSAWEALGGGPADLTFPESWIGVWDVTSTLVSVDLPMGEDVVPNMASVQRAKQQDLQKALQYKVAFMRNGSGKVVYDRRFNTAALLAAYYGSNMDFAGRISWNPQDPNALNLTMPGGLAVSSRVLRRSEKEVAADRFETSEFMQQVFEADDPARPRVKASQCFTKYKFRDEDVAERAGGPVIVATQVVSDYLTPFDGQQSFLAAANKPITLYTYKMAFTRHHDATHMASALTVS